MTNHLIYMPSALLIAEFCVRTLMPESILWGAISGPWGLWAQSWLILHSSESQNSMRSSFAIGLITGLISSAHPLAVACSCALAAHITHLIITSIRLPSFLLMALTAGSFSLFSNALYWALLGLMGSLSFKTVEIGTLLETLPYVLGKSAFRNALSTACAFSLCRLIVQNSPLPKHTTR